MVWWGMRKIKNKVCVGVLSLKPLMPFPYIDFLSIIPFICTGVDTYWSSRKKGFDVQKFLLSLPGKYSIQPI